MTDEEIKAIEYLKVLHPMMWWQLPDREGRLKTDVKLQTAIDTVLNLIEKQQKEIKKYKEMYAVSVADRVNGAFKQEHKNNEDLEMLYKGCQIELEEKDKIIDEMARALKEYANLGFLIKCPAEYDGKYNYKYCKIDITKDRTEKTNRLCINCIKEYFKKKVEEK